LHILALGISWQALHLNVFSSSLATSFPDVYPTRTRDTSLSRLCGGGWIEGTKVPQAFQSGLRPSRASLSFCQGNLNLNLKFPTHAGTLLANISYGHSGLSFDTSGRSSKDHGWWFLAESCTSILFPICKSVIQLLNSDTRYLSVLRNWDPNTELRPSSILAHSESMVFSDRQIIEPRCFLFCSRCSKHFSWVIETR
jgi:hypothetical protein